MRRMEGWLGARDELMKAYDVFEASKASKASKPQRKALPVT